LNTAAYNGPLFRTHHAVAITTNPVATIPCHSHKILASWFIISTREISDTHSLLSVKTIRNRKTLFSQPHLTYNQISTADVV